MRNPVLCQALLLCTALILVAGCNSDNEDADLTCADWGYEADNGPANWASLCSATCAGARQSPINIVTASVIDEDLPEVEFEYEETEMTLFNNGHTIEVADEKSTKSNAIEIDGKRYELLQFHFHSLSEHTINGQHNSIEMHLVHRFSDTDLAVIGVMINAGATNPAFDSFWNQLPAEESTPEAEVEVELASLLPADRDYFQYSGSLTTPNKNNPSASCAEIVNWIVMKEAIEMSPAQIQAFQAIFNDNYRPVQPLNARAVSG
jgi:carbonic anhydrase